MWGTRLYLPGGGVKKEETFSEAARREVWEELGSELMGELEPLGEYASKMEGKHDTIQIFIASVPDGWEPKDLPANKYESELEGFGWYDVGALPDNVSSGTMRRIQEYLAGERNITGRSW